MTSSFVAPSRDFPNSFYNHLLVTIENGIALVRFNRPEKYNAMNFRLHYEIGKVWRDLDMDERVKVIVVTGEGKAFSAGGDIDMTTEMTQNSKLRRQVFNDARALYKEMIDCQKPIVSAVNGPAVGAGMVVAVLSDISIASEKAIFGDGHTKLGVAAGDHASGIWPLAMGIAKAKYYLLTGENLTAQQAEKYGLITEVVPHDKVLSRAFEVANILVNGPQHAIRATKYALNQWHRLGVLASTDASLGEELLNFSEEDAKEGVKSFTEKRKPKFPSSSL